MSYVIRLHDYRGDQLRGEVFVKECDFEAYDGRGDLVVTSKREEAKVFSDTSSALAYWNTPSKVRPLREDGRPNKPLTAFTVSVEKGEDQ